MNSGCATCGTGTLYPQTRLGRAMMNGVQSKAMVNLSETTIRKLADALTADAIEYLLNHNDYADVMYRVVSQFLDEKMGPMDKCVKTDIIFAISCNLNLTNTQK